MTIFRGHLIAAACLELRIESPDNDVPQEQGEPRPKVRVSEIASRVVDKWTINPEAILGEHVLDSGDCVNNYAHVLCHLAAPVAEFTDAWSEGNGPRIIRCRGRYREYSLVGCCLDLKENKTNY